MRPIERNFEIAVSEQNVSETEKRILIQEIIKGPFKQKESKINKFNFKKARVLPVQVLVDDEELYSKGEILVEIYTPYRSDETLEAELIPKSLANEFKIYWISAPDPTFNEGLERVKASKRPLAFILKWT